MTPRALRVPRSSKTLKQPPPIIPDDVAQYFSTDTELDRRLGLPEAFSIVVGRIIGSGIFRTPGPIMAAVGLSVGLFFGVWVLGAVATILGAFLYAEMVAMMPRSGGPYAFLRTAYHPLWAFLRGWAMFFVSETGAIAAVAVVFAEYGNALFEVAYGAPYSRLTEVLIALGLIWALTSANTFGVMLGGLMQDAFSLVKLLALGAVIGIGFAKAGTPAHFTGSIWPETFDWTTLVALGAGLRYAFFAYSGWEGPTYIAEEVKNPRRTLPLALFLGISGIMVLYIAANGAYLYQLSPAAMAESQTVAVDVMTQTVGASGGILISLAIMMNTFGNVSAQVMVKSRTWYAMARDGLFPRWLARIHPKYKTPNRALFVQGAWASVLLVAVGFAEEAYDTLIDFFSFTSTVFNISTFLAVWQLRRKYPDAERPYRVWGYPLTLILVLTIQIWFLVVTAYDKPWHSAAGVLLTCTGLLYYYRGRLFGAK